MRPTKHAPFVPHQVLGFIEPENPKPEEEAQPDEEPKLEQEAQPPSVQTPMRLLLQSQMQTRRQLQTQMQHTTKLPPYLLKVQIRMR